MSDVERIVIIGGGVAAGNSVAALRNLGYSGRIELVSDEVHLPYDRPPLSKAYLAGYADFESALIQPEAWYRDAEVVLRLGSRAVRLDASNREVELADGSSVSYDRLLLATGSAPRRLAVLDDISEHIYTLRTREDSDAIREFLGEGHRLIVVGAGWIGLEVAAIAREADTEVDLVEADELPLRAGLGRELGSFFADAHRAQGVRLHLASEIIGAGRADDGVYVTLRNGEKVCADAIVVGVGATPRTELAAAAGLRVSDGVEVDARLCTSNEYIFAVGDIARQQHPILGESVRVQHWDSAVKQPEVAAAAILGKTARYEELPYFYSDQYELGIEYAGYVPPNVGTKLVVRGSLDDARFVVFWLDSSHRLLAAASVGIWDALPDLRDQIARRACVEPERLADKSVPYAELSRS